MRILGIGDNVFDHYRWRHELYPGGNSVNVPVLAHRFDGFPRNDLASDCRLNRNFEQVTRNLTL